MDLYGLPYAIYGAVHKVRHAIFGQYWPPPPCHTLSHIPGPPEKYVTHLGPSPIFSRPSTKILTKAPCTNSLSIVRWGFVRDFDFCLEGFARGAFCSFPLLSECMCYNRKL